MTTINLTPEKVTELEKTGRVTVEREVENKVEKCPNHGCDDSGGYVVLDRERQYITREMALDACDPSLEGQIYHDDEFELEQCQFCYEKENSLFNIKQNSPFKVGEVYWVAEDIKTDPSEEDIIYLSDGVHRRFLGKALFWENAEHKRGSEIIKSIFMPQWASRYNVECLTSDIKEKDGKWYWEAEMERKK